MNDRIFRGKFVEPEEIFYRIQAVSWKLLLSKNATSPCLFYKWCVECRPFSLYNSLVWMGIIDLADQMRCL
jgi:hypothetical protein